MQRQTNGTSGSPASAAHKGRILIELSSLLGFKPPVGIRRVKRERGREQEMVWSHASLSDKAVLSACQVVTQLARADAQKVTHTLHSRLYAAKKKTDLEPGRWCQEDFYT